MLLMLRVLLSERDRLPLCVAVALLLRRCLILTHPMLLRPRSPKCRKNCQLKQIHRIYLDT